MDFETLKENMGKVGRAKVIGTLTIVFSLIYHVAFMIVFLLFKVYPMFFYNIFSVSLFFTLTLLTSKIKSYVVPFFFGFVEVVTHQILADIFVGGSTSFHFFIFLIGVLAYLELDGKILLSCIYAGLSCVLFIVMEVLSPYIQPVYVLDESVLLVFRSINVTLGVTVIFIAVLIFTYIVWHVEKNLEFEVKKKTSELEIQNQRNFDLQENIIHSLASLVENRDADTGEHIQRTSAYVEMLARKAYEKGLFTQIINEEYITLLKKSAPMHDIGKIVVPDSVLKKPGKLTEDEFAQMQLHTIEGGRIIKEVIGISDDNDFVRIASEIATSHHERWDGRGYPYKLAGDAIPLSARIMAIADVFDALVSPRCYKDPIPQEKAFAIMEEETGTHFDPVLGKLFLEMKNDVLHILEDTRL